MTSTTTALLRRTEAYLSALHGSVARHDNLAANLGCAGCELRDKLRTALAAPPAVWVEGDPLMEAIAAAIWERCSRDDVDMPQLVLDDPRNIAAAAAAGTRAIMLREAAEKAQSCVALFEDRDGVGAAAAVAVEGLADRFRRMATEAQPSGEEFDYPRDPDAEVILNTLPPEAQRRIRTQLAAEAREDGEQPCSAALLPFGTAPADPCVVKGKHLEHVTAEGRRWTVEEPRP